MRSAAPKTYISRRMLSKYAASLTLQNQQKQPASLSVIANNPLPTILEEEKKEATPQTIYGCQSVDFSFAVQNQENNPVGNEVQNDHNDSAEEYDSDDLDGALDDNQG